MIPRGGYTSGMKLTEDEALREYIRRLDDLMSFVGREELPYSLTDLAHGPSANDGTGSQGEGRLGRRRDV